MFQKLGGFTLTSRVKAPTEIVLPETPTELTQPFAPSCDLRLEPGFILEGTFTQWTRFYPGGHLYSMDAFSELAAISRARGCGPVPIAYPLSGTGPSKPLGKCGIAYPSGAGVPACARGAAAADVGERVFSRVRDANMNEESYTYVAAPQLFPTNMSIDVGVQSFVQLLIAISAAAKDDTILMAFFASHGTILPAGARIYAASPADAAIDHAMRNVPTPPRHQAGKLIFSPHEVVERRLALTSAAGRPTPLAGPVFSAIASTPTGSLASHDNILPHFADPPFADSSGSGIAGPSLLDTDPPDIMLSPPADASGSGLADSYPFDADVPDIMLSEPGAPVDAATLATPHRPPGADDPFASTAFADFKAATRDDTLDPDTLSFGPPADSVLYSSPPAAVAPTAAPTGPAPPAADARDPLRSGSNRTTLPHPSAREPPTASPQLLMPSPPSTRTNTRDTFFSVFNRSSHSPFAVSSRTAPSPTSSTMPPRAGDPPCSSSSRTSSART